MQDLKNAQFKRDNVLLWLSLSKIQSESESHYFVTMSEMIETEWTLWFFKLFFFNFKE